jgi:hypothetical protein
VKLSFLSSLGIVAGRALFLACTERGAGSDPKRQNVSATSPKSESPPVSPGAAQPPTPQNTLFGQLEREAKARPTETPKAEEVIDALKRAGIMLEAGQQYLATTVHAQYCYGGRTSEGLGIAICEYGTEDTAEQGRKYSLESFRNVPNRQIHRNRKTTLTLTASTPESHTQVPQTVATFKDLP